MRKIKYIFILLWVLLVCLFGLWWYKKTIAKENILVEIVKNKTKINWLDDRNPTSRPMEEASRQIIEADYADAWKQQSICLLTGDTAVLYSFFEPNIRKIIKRNADELAENNIQLKQIDEKHKLQLWFYSLDGQVVTLTDEAVVRQQINDYQKIERRRYDVLLILEEGHWRIKNLKLNE